MKRIIAFLLAVSFAFLCSCSKNDNNSKAETTTTSTASLTDSQSEESKVEYITEWESELLPEDFPPPPKSAYGEAVSILAAENEYSRRCHDITRLIFSCPENEFYIFANSLISYGFYGGMKKVTDGTFYTDGFWGGWRGDKYTVIIADSTYEDNGDLKICLDIVEKFSAFPEALKEFFPEFNFPARTMGTYVGHNSDVDETHAFYGKIEHINWQWHTRFRSAFIGVSSDDFDDYCIEFLEQGFEGKQIPNTVDGCSIISCDFYKGENLAAFMLYNKTLKTLDVVYTNDPQSITG